MNESPEEERKQKEMRGKLRARRQLSELIPLQPEIQLHAQMET